MEGEGRLCLVHQIRIFVEDLMGSQVHDDREHLTNHSGMGADQAQEMIPADHHSFRAQARLQYLTCVRNDLWSRVFDLVPVATA